MPNNRRTQWFVQRWEGWLVTLSCKELHWNKFHGNLWRIRWNESDAFLTGHGQGRFFLMNESEARKLWSDDCELRPKQSRTEKFKTRYSRAAEYHSGRSPSHSWTNKNSPVKVELREEIKRVSTNPVTSFGALSDHSIAWHVNFQIRNSNAQLKTPPPPSRLPPYRNAPEMCEFT
jgi:hypothetical protein